MKDFTTMNFLHSKFGYYYKSPEKLENYLDSKISYKKEHLTLDNCQMNQFYDDEINDLKLIYQKVNNQYEKYINTDGNVFYRIVFYFILLGIFYPLIINLLDSEGILFSNFSYVLNLIIVISLILLWLRGFFHSHIKRKIANKINVISSVIQNHNKRLTRKKSIFNSILTSKPINKSTIINFIKNIQEGKSKRINERKVFTINEETQLDKKLQLNEDEKKVLFSCINFLVVENLIVVMDKSIQKEYSNHTTRELHSLSQVNLSNLLVKCLKENRIKVNAKIQQQTLVQSITNKMKFKNGSSLDLESFKSEFSRTLKNESIPWSTLN